MERKQCLVCLESVSKSESWQNQNEDVFNVDKEAECKTVRNQLQMIFLFRRFLEIPEDMCCKFLEDYGNPCTWVDCCITCSSMITKAKQVFYQILLLQKKFEKLQTEFRNSILLSVKSQDYFIDNSKSGANEVRSYIRREYDNICSTTKPMKIEKFSEFDTRIHRECNSETFRDSETEFLENLCKNPDENGAIVQLSNIDFSDDSGGEAEEDPLRIDVATTSMEIEECASVYALEIEPQEDGSLSNQFESDRIDRITIADTQGYICGTCNKKFCSQSKLELHAMLHCDQLIRNSVVSQPSAQNSGPFSCKECGRTFFSLSLLQFHLSIQKKGTEHSSQELTVMQNECETNLENVYNCGFCSKRYGNTEDLEMHLKSHSTESPYSCEFCGKAFKTPSFLLNHRQIHSGEKSFECSVCRQRFTNTNNLIAHQRAESCVVPVPKEKTSFRCETCGKGFNQLAALKTHLNVHARRTCRMCNLVLPSASSLKDHYLTVHLEGKLHSCKHCGKAFRFASSLYRHILAHKSSRPFSCNVCQRKFLVRYDLKRHKCKPKPSE